MGTEYEIIEKSGSWFAYNGEKIGQGKEKAKDMLKNNPALQYEIENKIKAKIFEKKVGI